MDISQKNCNVSCRPKMLSSWTFFAVKVNGSDQPRAHGKWSWGRGCESDVTLESVLLLQGVLMYKRAVDFRISVYFHQIVLIRFKIKWYIFSP